MLHSHHDRLGAVPRPQLHKHRRPTSVLLRVAAACLVVIAVAVHYTDYGPLIPYILRDLHIASGQAGLMSTLLFIGLAVTYVPAGILADRYGQRPVLLYSLVLMIVGGVLLPLWSNLFWMLMCRAIIGLGSGGAFIAGVGIAAGAGKYSAIAQGLYGGFSQVGSGLGLLLPPFLASQISWQGAFLVCGLLSVPALLIWWFLDDGAETHREEQVEVATSLRSRSVWLLGLTHMGTFGVSNAIAAWVTVYLTQQYGASLEMAALFGFLSLAAGAFLRPLGGFLLGRELIGSVSLLRFGTILAGLGVAVLAFPWNLPALAIAGLSFITIGSALPHSAVFNSAAQLRTVNKGVAQGLISMVSSQTVLWGPPLIGFLFQITGTFSLPFSSILLFSAVAVGAAFLVGPVLRYEGRRSRGSSALSQKEGAFRPYCKE